MSCIFIRTDIANSLNQYSSIQTEGSRYILGEAPATDAVTVNGAPANRAGGLGFYWKQLTNSYRPNWNHDTVASNGTSIGGFTWTPEAEVVPTFDDDGNLTSDGRWTYSWDAENRLVQMQTTAAAIYVGVPNQRLTFAYDSQSRRIAKKVASSTDGQTWTVQHESRFLYDGWNLIAEYKFHSSTLTLHSSFSWGNDLSGTPQGAGGVCGLLSVTLHDGALSTNVYPSYDGNGNISAWSNATGALLARMDYSPFGQLLTQHKFTPPGDTTLARLPFGFSTKYTDAESGLLYYGYRFYDPVAGRWINRDPIEERGGINLYGMVGNDPVNFWDLLGMICPVKITLSDASNGKTYIAQSYPERDHEAYEVPVYTLTVSCGNKVSCGKAPKIWDALRFMPYLNIGGGHGYKTKTTATPMMTGLADKREAPSPEYKASYAVLNQPSTENGAIVITGTFYLHAGPTSLTNYGWGAAGCTEVIGYTSMKDYIAELSGQPGKSTEEAIKELVKHKMLIIKLEQATRPTVKVVPMPAGYTW